MAFADAYVFSAVLSILGILARYPTIALSSPCAVGDDTGSSRFGREIVFGLFPNGKSSADLGDFGSFMQTASPPPGTDVILSRPFSEASLETTVEAMPKEKFVGFTPATTVTRTTGVHEGTLRITSDDPIRTYAYGSNSANLTFGAMGTIPLDYLGQEYFAVVRADPGLGQLVISSTGQPTLVRLTPNAAFKFDEILYDDATELDIELPAWGQATITVSSNNFTGSRILANESVSAVSGAACAYSPGVEDGPCDYAIEQLLPYDRWGTVFNVAPFDGGPTPGYYVQVTAGRDNTSVIINRTAVDLDQGETFDVDITTDAILRITSDQPVQVVKYMKGAVSMVLVPPKEQYTNLTTYIRMNGVENHSFSHYFTVVIPCADSSGLGVVYRKVGTSDTSMSVASFSTWSDDGMCAFSSTGFEGHMYTITHSDSRSNFFVEVYGRSNSGSFAYIGNQKYERLRCIDYDSLLYDSTTTWTSIVHTSATTGDFLTTPAETTYENAISTHPTSKTAISYSTNVAFPMGTSIHPTQSTTQRAVPTTTTTAATTTTTTTTATTTITIADNHSSIPPSLPTAAPFTTPTTSTTAISQTGTTISRTQSAATTSPTGEMTSTLEATSSYVAITPQTSDKSMTAKSTTRSVTTTSVTTDEVVTAKQPPNLATTPVHLTTPPTTISVTSDATHPHMQSILSTDITTDPTFGCVNVSSNVTTGPSKQILNDLNTVCGTSSTTSRTGSASSTVGNSSSHAFTAPLSENVTSSILKFSAPRSAVAMCHYLAKLKLDNRRLRTSPLCAASTKSSSPSSWVFGNSAEIGGIANSQPTPSSVRTATQASNDKNQINSHVRKNQSYIFPISIVVFGAGLPTTIACYYLWRKPNQQYEVLGRQRSGPGRRDKVQAIPLSRLVSDL